MTGPERVQALADLLRSRYATEGLEIQGIEGNCVHAAVPHTTANITGLLTEVYEDTGAEADLTLTSEGAVLQFWASAGSRHPAAATAWRPLVAAALAVVAAVKLAADTGSLPELPPVDQTYFSWWPETAK